MVASHEAIKAQNESTENEYTQPLLWVLYMRERLCNPTTKFYYDYEYLKVTKFNGILNLVILASTFFLLNFVHAKLVKCMANWLKIMLH